MKYKGFRIEQDFDGFTVISRAGAILGTFDRMSKAYDLVDSITA